MVLALIESHSFAFFISILLITVKISDGPISLYVKVQFAGALAKELSLSLEVSGRLLAAEECTPAEIAQSVISPHIDALFC